MATWRNQYVRVNQYTRPGIKLNGVRKVIVHWTANPGATAANHFRYFDQTAVVAKRYASAHIFVDKIEAICIVPLNEVAYAANDGSYRGVAELKPNANFLSISVELCVEKDGTLHPDTIARAVAVCKELCATYGLDPSSDIVRHYDVTHKNCPAPWVSNVDGFTAFKAEVCGTPSAAVPSGAIGVGSTVTVKRSATHYETGQPIADFVKGGKYTIVQEKAVSAGNSKKAYLLGVILSWVYEQDIEESGVSNGLENAQPAPVAPPPPAQKKEYAYFPSGHGTWSVYPLNKQPIKKNAVGAINPTKFGGLTYEVLGKPFPDVVTIQTSNFGKVNIYVGDPNSQLIWK
jgi:N-acetylmuramoyl-L-alanine amidase